MDGLLKNILFLFCFTAVILACVKSSPAEQPQPISVLESPKTQLPPIASIVLDKGVRIVDFFNFLDSIVVKYDTIKSYKLTENLILRANPWILDSLVNTDYYTQMEKGNFIENQPQLVVLKVGDTIVIPDAAHAEFLIEKMKKTRIQINIPAFDLRIFEGDSLLTSFPVRIGKNQRKYLKMAGREVDLRTHTGKGEIYRVNRNPSFYDPVSGKKFKYTNRDDLKRTLMPQIPWIEPIINGLRYGQLIHPTTNPKTLGKAASNGCIGTGEADAWRVYFYAPIGTAVQIKYDLVETNAAGEKIEYPDIYKLKNSRTIAGMFEVPNLFSEKEIIECICEP